MRSLGTSYFIFFALIGIFVPYFNLYCRYVGFTALEVGAFLASFSIVKCISPLLWSIWADRTGKRKDLIILAGWGGAITFFGFLFTTDFWPMLGLSFLFGFFRSPLIPLVEATTWEQIPVQGWEYGKIRLWGSIGFIAATLITGILADQYSIRLILYMMAALLILQAVFFSRIPGPLGTPHHLKSHFRSLFGMRHFIFFLLVGFLIQVSHGMYYGFFSLHMDDLGFEKSVIGLNWTVSVVAEVLLMINYKKWFRNAAPMTVIALCCFLGAARWFVLSKTSNLVFILAIQSLHAMTFGASHIASLTYLNRTISRGLNARGQGLYSSVTFGLGIMAGSALGGFLYDRGGGFGMFGWASLVALTAGVLALCHLKRYESNAVEG